MAPMASLTGGETGVTVAGDREVTVTDAPPARDQFGWTSREFAIHCHTGRVIEGRWTGFPVAELTEAADPAPETTHLLVTGRDGHRACVPVSVVPGGLLGFVREEIDVTYPDDGEGSGDWQDREPPRDDRDDSRGDGTPRFLAEGVDSSHTVRNVATVEALSLDPDEDPHTYEIGE